MSYSVSGNKWIFSAGVADVYCIYHIHISSFHQPAPLSIIKLHSYNNSTDWKEMCVHNMHQEINLVTAPATHSMHYMCQRSRIYSGHLCSTGVEKGKRNRLCYNGLDSLSPAKNNACAWADRDCRPSRQQGVALQDVSVPDSQLCVHPSFFSCLYSKPCSVCCTPQQQPLTQPPPCSAHTSQEHLLLPNTPRPM